ncbi:MAG: radical SAM protein [Candidatus Woesearchaeota archaeon]
MAEIQIGTKCNSNCIMCTTFRDNEKNNLVPKKELLKVINETKDNSFLVTGGEPTLRRDMVEILKYINKNKPNAKIDFITNGRVFYYNKAINKYKQIKNIKIITEIHGPNKEVHNEITRTKSSFKQTTVGIKKLLKNNFNVEIRIVISKKNYKYLPEMFKLIKREFKGIKRIVAFPIDIIGEAYKNKEDLIVKYNEFIPYLQRAIKSTKKTDIKIKLFHIPYCTLNENYFKYVKKGITVKERRVELSKICNDCKYKNDCPRVWKTYIKNVGKNEFKPIKNKITYETLQDK